jgi:hypothetical protein
MESETVAMTSHPFAFLAQFRGFHLRHGLDCLRERARAGNQFPGPFPLDQSAHQSLWSRRAEQTPIQFPKLTLAIVVGTRQPRHRISLIQPGVVVRGGLGDGLIESL